MITDVSVTINTYEWTGIDRFEANRFSDAVPTVTRSSLNILSYLEDKFFKVSGEAEGIRGDNEAAELLPSSERCSMKLFDYDGTLRTFFKILNDTTLVKWQMLIYNEGVLQHELWIHPGDVKYGTSLSSREVSVTAYGLMREFRDFFREADLPSDTEFPFAPHVLGGVSISNLDVVSLQTLLEKMFKISVDVEANREVVRTPKVHVYSNPVLGYKFIRNSYERTSSNGDNKWDFIRRLCNAWGDVFFFAFETGEAVLKIRPRSNPGGSVLSIPYADTAAEGYEEGKEISDTFDYILLFNGGLGGGQGAFYIGDSIETTMRGSSVIIMSNVGLENFNTEHFDYIEAGEGISITLVFPSGYSFRKYGSEDDEKYLMQLFARDVPPGTLNIGTPLARLSKERTLVIDGGNNESKMMYVDLVDGLSTGFEYNPIPNPLGGTIEGLTDTQMVYSGNYGAMVIRNINEPPIAAYVQDYSEYIKTDEFKNNFNYWKKSETRIMEYNYLGIVSSLDKQIFFNTRPLPFEANWQVRGFEVDYYSETTRLSLSQ